MKFVITQEQLLQGLQFVNGVVERRQNVPILANILLRVENNQLWLTGTDLEIELTSCVSVLDIQQSGTTTVSGRKLMDICRSLPADSQLIFTQEEGKILVSSGKSRFGLTTLSAADFPLTSMDKEAATINISQAQLLQLLEATYFAMAQQDVRYYLNGLFFEFSVNTIRAVATDGHRLALRSMNFQQKVPATQFILPRKGIMELIRLLDKDNTDSLQLQASANTLKLSGPDFTFVSRLIDGRFPDYQRVIPKNGDKIAQVDRDALRQVLQRVAILSNEKYHAVRLHFQHSLLSIHATNTELEEAQDELAIDYSGAAIEMGFNVNYFLDVLSVLPSGKVKITLSNPENSILIESDQLAEATFVIMPMCL